MLPGYSYGEKGLAVSVALLQQGEISYEAYCNLVGDVKLANKLLESNVFARRFYSDVISFQSEPMRRYCKGIYKQK